MARSPLGLIVSTSDGRPWSFLVNPSVFSFSRNGRTNDNVFPVPVPTIREQKPALQAKLI